MSELKKHFLHGVVWTGLRRFGEQGIQTVTTIILARILSPQEFGVIGIANIFILFANTINQLGVAGAIIQRKEIDEGHLSSAFWANMVTGVVLCLIMTGLSYPAAVFFKNVQVQPVLATLSLIFILGAFRIVQNARFSRTFQFGKLASIAIGEMLANSVVAIVLAVQGFGVWSLVWGRLFGVLTGGIIAWGQSPWRPKFLFEMEKFKQLFRFGMYTLMTNILTYFGQNLDYILIGRFLGTGPLGVYTMAYNMVTLPQRKISTMITGVAFSVFSRIQDDNKRMARNYLNMLRYISFVTFPLLTGLMVLAPLFVRVVLSEKWEAAIVPMQILCVLGMYSSLSTTTGSIFCAKGRPDLELKTDIVLLTGLVCFLSVGVRFGINGVALAVTLMSFVSKPFIFAIIARLLEIRLWDIYKASAPAFISSVGMAAATILADFMLDKILGVPMAERFILLLFVAGGSYLAFQKIFKIHTLKEIYEMLAVNLKARQEVRAGL